jgi:hypothetical protein
VAFWSLANNLDPGDVDRRNDVYVKDLTTGDIALASTSDTGVNSNIHSNFFGLSLSADGRTVAFSNNSDNLDPADTDTNDDIYVKDLTTGDITLASTSDTGAKANSFSKDPLLSSDGRTVAFSSIASNLDPADADGFQDVFVKDLTTGDVTLVSTSETAVKGNETSGASALAADATKLVLHSRATNLDPADTDTNFDVYVKNLATGDLTMVSASDAGVTADKWADRGSPSADFTRVAFHSIANNLDPPRTAAGDVYVKTLPATPTSIDIGDCSNGNSGTASVVDIRSYGSRPLGCPTSLGGAAGNEYADTTPILVGGTLSMTIDWATGPDSYGVAAAKAGTTGTQWRFRLAITASPGHETPATNQYLPAAGSGATKTRLQGKLDWSALDSFDCMSGVDDPIGWVGLVDNATWVAKTS